jgi:alkaline phosphatase D
MADAGSAQPKADWNLLANQVPFAPSDTNADVTQRAFGGEKWDGYPADRHGSSIS